MALLLTLTLLLSHNSAAHRYTSLYTNEGILIMRKMIAYILAACILLGSSSTFVSAYSPTETITYFEDGSYCITSLSSEACSPTSKLHSLTKIQTGTKSSAYYNSSHEPQFSITVYGAFNYDGTNSTAIESQYRYKIHSPSWRFIYGNADHQG